MCKIESTNTYKKMLAQGSCIQSFGHIINIMHKELKTRNLEYVEIQNLTAPDNMRTVFDMLTTDLNNRKQCVVHVDFIQTEPTVEQFLDCVYGSGSTSDLKIIIYNDNYIDDTDADFEEWTELYFVTRLINKCTAVSIPFDIIGYNHPLDKSILAHQYTLEFNPEAVESYLQSGPLPTKWDIRRMAFWAIFYHTKDELMEPYELHRLQPVRSLGFQIAGDLGIFVEWTEDGIYYVIADSNNSEFIPWLWKNRSECFGKNYPDHALSFCRDGVSSCISLLLKDTPFHKMSSMSNAEMRNMGKTLYRGATNLEMTVSNRFTTYESEAARNRQNSIQ